MLHLAVITDDIESTRGRVRRECHFLIFIINRDLGPIHIDFNFHCTAIK